MSFLKKNGLYNIFIQFMLIIPVVSKTLPSTSVIYLSFVLDHKTFLYKFILLYVCLIRKYTSLDGSLRVEQTERNFEVVLFFSCHHDRFPITTPCDSTSRGQPRGNLIV